MPRLGRLTRRPEFLRVAAARHKCAMPGLVVQARARLESAADAATPGQAADRPAGDEAPVRVGLTVSRKVGNAVARNRARRRLRALAREVLPAEGEAGVDYVLIGRKATLDRPYPALRADLSRALARLRRGGTGAATPKTGRSRRGAAARAKSDQADSPDR